MILLTGAGGKTGRALLRTLSDVESVRALVHRDEQVSAAKELGAEHVVLGDMHDETVVRSAMHGVRAVYHICPNMNPDETAIGELLIRAAQQSGVEHFAYHSVLHPQTEKMNHHWQKLRVEEMLFESRLPFTILQPAPYMQNLLAGWKSIREYGVLPVPYSIHAKFSFVDLEDAAEAAKIVLTEPGHVNAVYELAGTQPISHAEVAMILSDVFGREIRAEKEETSPVGMLREDWRLRKGALSAYAAENLVRMFEYYDKWGFVGNSNVLRWVLKREPTTLESFVLRSWKERDAIQ